MAGNYFATSGSTITTYLKYYPEKRILEVGFRTKEVYHYLEFPLKLWKNYYNEVSSGGSSGKFFNEHVREKYGFIKVT